jgi:hypothetical protein
MQRGRELLVVVADALDLGPKALSGAGTFLSDSEE